MSWYRATALAAGTIMLLGAVRQAPAQVPPPDSAAERAALGRKLFEGKGGCFSCHGKNGEGVIGPSSRLAGRPLTHTKVTVAGIISLIKTGVDSAHSTSGQVMPPRGGFRISDAEVEELAWYVLELQAREKPHP